MADSISNAALGQSSNIPEFKVKSGGEYIHDQYTVNSLVVNRQVNKIPFARLIMMEADASSDGFKVTHTGYFSHGSEIVIEAGYDNDIKVLFEGIVVKTALKSKRKKAAHVCLDLQDVAVRMTIGRKNAYFTELEDSDIISQIISDYSLESDVEATATGGVGAASAQSGVVKEAVQFNATDWDFMLSRAEKNGKLVFVEDGKVIVSSPNTGQDSALSCEYGSNILEFESEMDARHQYKAVTSNAIEEGNQSILNGEGTEPDIDSLNAPSGAGAAIGAVGGFLSGLAGTKAPIASQPTGPDLAEVIGLDSYQLHHGGNLPDGEVQAWADAQMLKSRLSKVCGRVKVRGNNSIKPGQIVELKGVGNIFSGKVYVTGVSHQITPQYWETDIVFGLDPSWFSESPRIVEPPAAGLVPGVYGLQIGVVTQIHEDPEGEFRILVRMPIVSESENGIWARLGTLEAGNGRGAFFYPEVGDEVILGFVNGDPREPIILGSLYNSASAPAFTPAEENFEHGWVSKNGTKLVFNDEVNSVTIESPEGNILEILDDEGDSGGITLTDKHGNALKMDKDGITLESAKDITLKATENIVVEATKNIEQKATSQYIADGQGGMELNSSATTKVSGAIVQIN